MNWQAIDNFAGGLAHGIESGVRLYDTWQDVQDRKKKREDEQAERDAVAQYAAGLQSNLDAGQVLQAPPSTPRAAAPAQPALQLAGPATAQATAQSEPRLAATGHAPYGAAHYPGSSGRVVPMEVIPVDGDGPNPPRSAPGLAALSLPERSAPEVVARRTPTAPGGALAQSLPGAAAEPAKPAAARGGGDSAAQDWQQHMGGLTAAMQAARKRGNLGRASQLFLERERLANEADGKRRTQALQSAITQFNTTGNPRGVAAYFNTFLSSNEEITSIARVPDKGEGGEPVYVIHGIDHQTGEAFANPMSAVQINHLLHAAADPAVHQRYIVDQAKSLFNQQEERARQSALAAKDKALFDHKAPIEQQHRLAQIAAQGQETRRNQDNAARNAPAGAAPAEVRTAEWLMQYGIAPDPENAWAMVRSMKEKPRREQVQEMTRHLISAKDDRGTPLYSPQQAQQEALRMVQRLDTLLAADGTASPSVTDGLDEDPADDISDERLNRARQLLRGGKEPGQDAKAAPAVAPESHFDKWYPTSPRVF